jgi:hypothetical protein
MGHSSPTIHPTKEAIEAIEAGERWIFLYTYFSSQVFCVISA